MSDEDWERARSDHYRSRRYDREHESESYTLARQQLQRHKDAAGRQTAGSQIWSDGPLGERGRLIGLAVIGGVIALYMMQPSSKEVAQQRAETEAMSARLNLKSLRESPAYQRHLRAGLNDQAAMLATEVDFIRYVGGDAKGSNDLSIVREYCGDRPRCASQNIETVVAATANRLGRVMVENCNDLNHQTELCQKKPEDLPNFGGGKED